MPDYLDGGRDGQPSLFCTFGLTATDYLLGAPPHLSAHGVTLLVQCLFCNLPSLHGFLVYLALSTCITGNQTPML